jgi:probable aminopeptidase NPEPL1
MSMALNIHADPTGLGDVETLLIIGRAGRLLSAEVRGILPPLPPGAWDDMVRRGDPGDNGRNAATYTGAMPRKVVAGVLPEGCSRHNAPSRAWAIPGLVKGAGSMTRLGVVLAVDASSHAYPAMLGLARAVAGFDGTSGGRDQRVDATVLSSEGFDVDRVTIGAEAVRFAARLVDAPPNQLNTTALVETARELVSRLEHTRIEVLQGEELLQQGLGGLWGVGKASLHPPALVVLDYEPPGSEATPPRHLAWVGKGITFDTGGLSIKTKTGMPGMKSDMAGAAAVLAAFAAAVRLGTPHRLTAVLCVAENSVGPLATRPDDILTMYSGRTVEVNNTDAEGRLVLADGLAWVVRNRGPHEIVDMATLTGAQSIATGKRHAALYCNDEALELRAVAAGRASGDLVHPLPFAPELYRGEFQSSVADMKNSVKDRNNAQSSCAAQFLLNHIPDFRGPWLHVDMAAPAVTSSGRGTGYGVGLLLTLAGVGAT